MCSDACTQIVRTVSYAIPLSVYDTHEHASPENNRLILPSSLRERKLECDFVPYHFHPKMRSSITVT
jgi:hypothetical protein